MRIAMLIIVMFDDQWHKYLQSGNFFTWIVKLKLFGFAVLVAY